ncbi:hypothetical protein MKEN_00182400 [Mycena kentingensis (nom. inval.)]|nr:hypothetical protein MKEN_00182400 [Mycena kentingensis (nom. inval.)]
MDPEIYWYLQLPCSLPSDSMADPDAASNLTSGLTAALACAIPLLAFAYVGAIFWAVNSANRRRLPSSKNPPSKNLRYSLWVYSLLVVVSLILIAIPSWLLLQFQLRNNYANRRTIIALQLILFDACWTGISAGASIILSIHPSSARHPISSIGTQSIWTLVTLALWIAGATVLSGAVPQLFNACAIYCHHLRAVYVLCLLQIITLTTYLLLIFWLAWRCARDARHPPGVG